MGKRHNYRNLKIWQLGLEIAKDTADICHEFPDYERFALYAQISRCSISLASNIAEGSGRSEKGFKNFLNYALGSCFELETQLLIAHHKKYINANVLNKMETKIREWQRMTMGFQNGLG